MNLPPAIRLTIWGRPQQRGSKQAVLIPKRGGGFVTNAAGRPIVAAKDMNPKSKDWMAQVRQVAGERMSGMELFTEPIRLSAVFYFKRPKAHFGAKGIKASAPKLHAQSPDLAKLVRCLEDGMTGVVYRDDKQVCQYGDVRREWTCEQERAEVTIEVLEPTVASATKEPT